MIKRPTTITSDNTPIAIDIAADRYLTVVEWAKARYTTEKFGRIEQLAFDRYASVVIANK